MSNYEVEVKNTFKVHVIPEQDFTKHGIAFNADLETEVSIQLELPIGHLVFFIQDVSRILVITTNPYAAYVGFIDSLQLFPSAEHVFEMKCYIIEIVSV